MNYKIKKIDIFLLVFLAIIIAITILCIINPTFGEYFSVANWFGNKTLSKINVWVAIGFTMLVCFLGALIPIPVPYTIPVTLFAAAWYRDLGITAIGLIIWLILLSYFPSSEVPKFVWILCLIGWLILMGLIAVWIPAF